MSAYSDWKCGALSDDEYKAAMRRECYDRIYPDASPEDYYHYTCQDCEYCKTYQSVFRWDIATREVDGKQIQRETREYRFVDLCIRDQDHIKEVHSYDDVCEDHGELFKEE